MNLFDPRVPRWPNDEKTDLPLVEFRCDTAENELSEVKVTVKRLMILAILSS